MCDNNNLEIFPKFGMLNHSYVWLHWFGHTRLCHLLCLRRTERAIGVSHLQSLRLLIDVICIEVVFVPFGNGTDTSLILKPITTVVHDTNAFGETDVLNEYNLS